VTRRQRAPHPGQLLLRGHLLGDQRGLDAVEETLEPADQLRLRDPQLGVAGRARPERQRDPVELLDELGRQTVLEFVDRAAVDLGQPKPPRLVQRRVTDLVEEVLDHRTDPHDLRGLLDKVGRVALLAALARVPFRPAAPTAVSRHRRGHAHPIGRDDDDSALLGLGSRVAGLVAHGLHLAPLRRSPEREMAPRTGVGGIPPGMPPTPGPRPAPPLRMRRHGDPKGCTDPRVR
jgi:hypothetical protein